MIKLTVVLSLLVCNFALAVQDSTPVISGAGQTPQEANAGHRGLIPQASFITSSLVGSGFRDSDYNVKSKSSWGAGLTSEIGIGSGGQVFETGILYRQLGAIVTPNVSAVPGGQFVQGTQATVNLNYLSVPIGIKVYLAPDAKQTVYIKFALLNSILLSKNESVDWPDQFMIAHIAPNGADHFVDGVQTYDLAGLTGVGARFNMGGGTQLVAELSYSRSFTGLYGASAIYNSALSGTAGLGLPF